MTYNNGMLFNQQIQIYTCVHFSDETAMNRPTQRWCTQQYKNNTVI